MNKRIKQLMGQTLDEKFAGTWSVMDLQDLTKFADRFSELIVKECAKVAYKYASDSENYDHYDDIGWDCLPSDLKSHIKEHFGVKE